jgi:hypothetical protein
MKIDLDHLKGEIEEHLKAHSFVIFRGHARISPSTPFVYWDVEQHPDFRMFLETAKQAGARLVVFHYREFSPDYLGDAADRLEAAELPREDQRRLGTKASPVASSFPSTWETASTTSASARNGTRICWTSSTRSTPPIPRRRKKGKSRWAVIFPGIDGSAPAGALARSSTRCAGG